MNAELKWIDGFPYLSIYDKNRTYLGLLSVEISDNKELVFTINTRKDKRAEIIETIDNSIKL